MNPQMQLITEPEYNWFLWFLDDPAGWFQAIFIGLAMIVSAIIGTIAIKAQITIGKNTIKTAKQTQDEITREAKLSTIVELLRIVDSKSALEARRNLYVVYTKQKDMFSDTKSLKQFKFNTRNRNINSSSDGVNPKDEILISDLCEEVFACLSQVGILLGTKVLEKVIVKEWLHTVPVKNWIVLSDYIKQRQSQSITKHAPILHLINVGFEFWYEHYDDHKDMTIFGDEGDQPIIVDGAKLVTIKNEFISAYKSAEYTELSAVFTRSS